MITPADFSIITTVYNGAPYLPRYLRTAGALAAASGAQIVIVDDGSTDNSIELVEQAAHPSVKLVRAARLGRAKALNLAVAEADRPLAAVQDVDDISLPHRLKRLADLASACPQAALLATTGLTVDETELAAANDYTHYVPNPNAPAQPKEFDASDIFNRNFLIHSAVAFKKEDWLGGGGYDESLKSCIDLDIYFALLKRGGGALDPVPSVLFSFNRDSFFRTRSRAAYRRDLFEVMRKARANGRMRLGDLALGYARAVKYTML